MTQYLASQQTEKLLQHTITGERPRSPDDGVDLATWKTGGAYAPVSIEIYLGGSAASTISSPAGGALGVELWGYKMGRWWQLHTLNDGAAVPIVSTELGRSEQVDDVGGFDRLFVAGSVSSGSAIAGFVPLEILL